jgi:galactonate dehydratase
MAAVEQFGAFLVGCNPFRTEHIWQTLFRGGFFPAQHVYATALAAVDIALWDIKGKALGVPLYELLGGLCRERVVCYPHVPAGDDEDIGRLVESCKELVAGGWRFVRWNLPLVPGGGVLEPRQAARLGIRQVEAVRAALGDDTEILIDCHTRLDLPDALMLCDGVRELNPFFVEDPLRSEDPHMYQALRSRTIVPLAAGEQYSSKWQFRELIEQDYVDFARIDVCIAGGITEAMKIAGWCETHHIKLAPHNPLGPVSSAACLHVDLASPNFAVQELPRVPGEALIDLFPKQIAWENGHLLPPTTPGLGIEFDAKAARKQGHKLWHGFDRLQRSDGSFTNW